MDGKASTEASATVEKKNNAPPGVITVDKSENGPDSSKDGTTASQARTPKHANKAKEEEGKDDKKPVGGQRRPPQSWSTAPYHGNFPFEPRGGVPFHHPNDRHSYPSSGPPAPMQVSPGGGRYLVGGVGNRFGNPQHEQWYKAADFSHAPSYPQRPPYQGIYPNGYDNRNHPSWGVPPSYGRPPHPQQSMSQEMYRGPATNGSFSRAVSSSFDRSIKSSHDKNSSNVEHSPKPHSASQPTQGDNGSFSEDASWGDLKQVHSVDEDELRRRISKRKERGDTSNDVTLNRSASNSSSLTNSPTEGVESASKKKQASSSRDSVSSVHRDGNKSMKAPPSPDGSSRSLDLVKCESGASTFRSSHQRSLSHFSLSAMDKDAEKTEKEDDSDGPPSKKSRTDLKDKKSSPLSITCSPPTSPDSKKKPGTKLHQPQPLYPTVKSESPQFFDKPPSYSYSMDSGPHPRPESLPPRPGSSASSTITPMNIDGGDMRQPPGVSQIPSWEIAAQDSFGAVSASGNGLMTSLSFPQDYPMLSTSPSNENVANSEHTNSGPMDAGPSSPRGMSHQPALESRNQSFEGGHYHGGFGRSDSMMSYEARQMSFDGQRGGYQGQFPPHAASWGSAGSYPPSYGHQRGYPPVMRNYSEDSARTSPPPPAGGLRMMPPSYPPPPEFRAPPSMVSKSNGQQTTLMTSPYQSNKVGAFGWSKDEDKRLTEIMKKYKNPRDWEPIAKDHGRNRSAKECHERWIRYLKPGVRKGQWTDHEDAVVMEVVTTSNEQPFTRWSDLAQRLPGRVGKQIRDRWVNHLNPAINHLPFSREDDLRLWDGHKKLGKRWVEISTKFFNNTRSENHIKNRWYSASFKKFIANEFGPNAYTGGRGTGTKKKLKRMDPALET